MDEEDEHEDEDVPDRMSSTDAWLFPIVSSPVLFLSSNWGDKRKRKKKLTFASCKSGRLCSLAWHVHDSHIRGQGMDQLATRLVFFDSWGGERMEGMYGGPAFFLLWIRIPFPLFI